MDANLSQLLKWGIENSTTGPPDPNAPPKDPKKGLDTAALAAIMGGPSDADLMKEAMSIITSPPSPEMPVSARLTAFDNFEQLIESLDNANNLGPLGLWTPLLEQLRVSEPEIRLMAAWCVGTAVQNNAASQERFVAMGKANGVGRLVEMVLDGTEEEAVRRKACYALSSAVRNFQPGLDMARECLPAELRGPDEVIAGDMEAVNGIIDRLRDTIAKGGV